MRDGRHHDGADDNKDQFHSAIVAESALPRRLRGDVSPWDVGVADAPGIDTGPYSTPPPPPPGRPPHHPRQGVRRPPPPLSSRSLRRGCPWHVLSRWRLYRSCHLYRR